MKYLVTGGLGFIGSHFIEHVLSQDSTEQVVNIDKGSYASNEGFHPKDYRYCLIREDIGDVTFLADSLEGEGFDVVVNFASHSHVDNSLKSPLDFLNNNINSFFKFLGLCSEWQLAEKIGKFVHISTDEVHGDLKDGDQRAFNEESPLKPSSPYSSSKASQEMFIHAVRKTYDFKANILRLSNNFGPRQHAEKFLPTVILNSLKNKSIPVYGDGSQEREWMYVGDSVEYIRQVCESRDNSDDYCISDGTYVDNLFIVHAIYNLMKHRFKLPASPSIEHVEDRLGHDRAYKLDCTKFKKSFELAEPSDINPRLQKTIDYYFYKLLKSEQSLPHLAVAKGVPC
jgi:dTDP-glucose 4,6-dehydratase